MTQESKQSIMEHLDELRKRMMISAIAVAITTAISFVFVEDIIDLLKSVSDDVNLQAIEMTEIIGTYFKVAFMAGFGLALPVIVYQIVMFVQPALTAKERRYVYTLLPGVMISFVVGVVFAYLILVPPAIGFLTTFGSDVAEIQLRIGNYVSTVARLIFVIGLCFELPLIIYFLAKIGVVTVEKLSRFRKYALLAAFVVAAIITPTFDPVNQCIVAVPLIILYEVGILLARIAQRGKKKKEDEWD